MKPITKKLSYRNVDERMEKLSTISQEISDNKQTKHKFQLESGIDKIVSQNLSIQSRNMINCLGFFMGHLGIQENQIYQSSYIYNQNDDWVYNEMHRGNWWQEEQKEFPAEAIIILILLASDKTIMSLSHKDQVFWPVYVTIDNLDTRHIKAKNRPSIVLLGLIPIVYE